MRDYFLAIIIALLITIVTLVLSLDKANREQTTTQHESLILNDSLIIDRLDSLEELIIMF